MEINTLILGDIGVRCYQVATEDAAVVIDPGFKNDKILHFLEENKNKERLILLTHAHFDHVGYAEELRKLSGVKIAIGELDNPALADTEYNLSYAFGVDMKPFEADVLLKDGEEFSIGSLKIKVMHTPGHTKGSVCYLMGEILFSGDTLFYESIGRDDFKGGNGAELNSSLLKLLELPDYISVLPGHNRDTTIAHERKYNPYIIK